MSSSNKEPSKPGPTKLSGRSGVEKKSEPVQTPQGPFRILVADDEFNAATLLAGLVRGLGHTVVGVAGDGEAAVAMARQQQPDLALLDIQMPKLSGTEVAMVLCEELGIPSVMVSAFGTDEHLRRIQSYGASSGVYGYLVKPVDTDDLRVAIGVAMHKFAIAENQGQRIVQLEQNLNNRRLVEQAKWILVEKLKITEPQAHEKLQKAARDKRMQLADVAKTVVDTGQMP